MFLFTVYWTRIRRASVTDVYQYFYSTSSTEGVCLFVRNHLTFNPNISSEIVDFQENGGVGDIQTQILYFHI